MEKYTKEELKEAAFGCLTMGDLAEFVYNNAHIPRDTKVLVERIQDVYFEKHNWKTLLVKGLDYYQAEEFNKNIANGKYETDLQPLKLTDDYKEQFFPAWCISKDRNEDFIYIYNHY